MALETPVVTEKAISRELMGKIVDEVFDGAIEDASVIEEIYAAIKLHEAALSTDAEPVAYYYISRNGVWHFIEAHEFNGETDFIPLYASPTAPSVAVKAKKPKLPPVSTELYEHYPSMSAQTHADAVKDYARVAVASALSAQGQDVP